MGWCSSPILSSSANSPHAASLTPRLPGDAQADVSPELLSPKQRGRVRGLFAGDATSATSASSALLARCVVSTSPGVAGCVTADASESLPCPVSLAVSTSVSAATGAVQGPGAVAVVRFSTSLLSPLAQASALDMPLQAAASVSSSVSQTAELGATHVDRAPAARSAETDF